MPQPSCWLLAACVFIVWMLAPLVGEEVLRAEIGYAGATAALVGFLFVLYRRGSGEPAGASPAALPSSGAAVRG